jgi:hypothetical protein
MTFYYGSQHGSRITEDELREQAYNGNHAYRPSFVKRVVDRNDDSTLYGLEFEFSFSGANKEFNAYTLLAHLNKGKRDFYCKHDGSVYRGFECNSMPMSINYLRSLDGDEVQKAFDNAGVVAHTSCGFHIHISREHIKDLVTFQENFYRLSFFFLWLSQRTDLKHMERYATLLLNDEGNSRELFSTLVRQNVTSILKGGRTTQDISSAMVRMMKQASSENRYVAFNTQNENTVEVRIFNGVTKWSQAMRYVEVVNWLLNISNQGIVINQVEQIREYGLKHEYDNMVNDIIRNSQKSRLGSVIVDVDSRMALARKPFKRVKPGDLLVLKRNLDNISYVYSNDESLKPLYNNLAVVTDVKLIDGKVSITYRTSGGSTTILKDGSDALFFEEVNPLFVVQGRKAKSFVDTVKKAYYKKPDVSFYSGFSQVLGSTYEDDFLIMDEEIRHNPNTSNLQRVCAHFMSSNFSYDGLVQFIEREGLTIKHLQMFFNRRDIYACLYRHRTTRDIGWLANLPVVSRSISHLNFLELFDSGEDLNIIYNIACIRLSGLGFLEMFRLCVDHDGDFMLDEGSTVQNVFDYIANDICRDTLNSYIDTIADIGTSRHRNLCAMYNLFDDEGEYEEAYNL